jgi:hypothetical protein
MTGEGLVRFLDTWIKVSKADPFRNGARLRVAENATATCPVAAVHRYMVVRGARGPKTAFYVLEDATMLTHQRTQRYLRAAIVRDTLIPSG